MLRRIAYELIGTPFERPAKRARAALRALVGLRTPGMREIHREENRVDAAMTRLIRRDANCLDVGCHYGSMLSEFVRRAPLGRHVAFEAMPDKVQFLRRKFPGVRIDGTALSDRDGSTRFFVNERRTGFSGLARHGDGTFREIEVPCRRLDGLADELPRVDFVKIDVEGGELFVLRGAAQLLVRDRPNVLFECTPSGPAAFGYTPGDLHDLLSSYGYEVYLPKDVLGGGVPIARDRFERALEYPFEAFNWFARPVGAAPLS